MRIQFVILGACMMYGCDRNGHQSVPDEALMMRGESAVDQEWDGVIPQHRLREQLLGEWADELEAEDGAVYRFVQDSDGTMRIEDADQGPWTVVINQVSWDGDVLCFDQYHYYELDHPFNGVRCAMRIELGGDPDRMAYSMSTETYESENEYWFVRLD